MLYQRILQKQKYPYIEPTKKSAPWLWRHRGKLPNIIIDVIKDIIKVEMLIWVLRWGMTCRMTYD